ncbi:protein spinster homolog 3-like [Heteronotia binoei]|uniref:protein spinster homolog 3-like n=1 Tax=Heteronotia binoei TaxID=13085 RepID=UPI00292DA573|nr:protein spinster homolog 3-like [Heteronotia binoei]
MRRRTLPEAPTEARGAARAEGPTTTLPPSITLPPPAGAAQAPELGPQPTEAQAPEETPGPEVTSAPQATPRQSAIDMNEESAAGPAPQPPLPLKIYGTIESKQESEEQGKFSCKRSYLAVAVLCYINLVNYMDWFVVPGVLEKIQMYFGLRDSKAGLLHTVFILCFLFSAPLFGYLGDRYNRKIILGAGILLWSGVTLGSSFITESMAWLFFISRGLVGTGTASYSTIAPSIIADLFEKDRRIWMLSIFYIFIPVGSGLGYILSSTMEHATGHWSWGFRVTPCMGVVGLVLLVLLVPESAHRAATKQEENAGEHGENSTWCKDVLSLCRNWSFVWSSLGVTVLAFVTGALSFWIPTFLCRAQFLHRNISSPTEEKCNATNSLIFGGMTVGVGILGVVAGAEAARRYKKINPQADPIICAVGLLASAPCIYLAIMLAQESIVATYIFIALGEFLLSLNWAVVTDILLYVVKPERQSTAMSLQLCISHLLGDAGSPYLIGIISDGVQKNQAQWSVLWSFRSLQYSFFLCAFVSVVGGGCFLLTAFRIEEDREKAAMPVQGTENKGYLSHEKQLPELPENFTHVLIQVTICALEQEMLDQTLISFQATVTRRQPAPSGIFGLLPAPESTHAVVPGSPRNVALAAANPTAASPLPRLPLPARASKFTGKPKSVGFVPKEAAGVRTPRRAALQYEPGTFPPRQQAPPPPPRCSGPELTCPRSRARLGWQPRGRAEATGPPRPPTASSPAPPRPAAWPWPAAPGALLGPLPPRRPSPAGAEPGPPPVGSAWRSSSARAANQAAEPGQPKMRR